MGTIALKDATFSDTGEGVATVNFDVTMNGGQARVAIQVVTRVKVQTNVYGEGSYSRTVADIDVIKEARRKLHEFATGLAEQTKDWAAP